MPSEPGEHRLAAILHADAVGYTRHLAEDEAATVKTLQGHMEAMVDSVAGQRGRVVNKPGDALLAEFPSAVAAIRCAIAIQQALAPRNAALPEKRRMPFRVGLHLGDVWVEDGAHYGDGINIAARIEPLAPPGGITVTGDFWRQVRSKVELPVEDLGDRELKNVPDPIRIYAIAAHTIPAPNAPAAADFVGRAGELAEGRTALDSALLGRGQLLVISGEPGIGKTRLAEELAREAAGRSAQVLYGRCQEGEAQPAYWLWIQMIRELVAGRDPESLREGAGRGAADLATIVPEIADRLGDTGTPEPTAPEAARFRLFDAITRLLIALSGRRPLVLVIEDLHWADLVSLQLLEQVAREIAHAHILIVGTYRSVDIGANEQLRHTLGELAGVPHAKRTLALQGLERAEVAELIERAGELDLPADVLESVFQRAGGHPLYTRELLDWLRGSGEESEGALPESLRLVISRRLARLSKPCRELLAASSVIGSEFELPVIQRIAGLDEATLLDALDEAEAARVVAEVRGDRDRFRFSHALVRDALQEDLGRRRRIQLHGVVGEALEALHPDPDRAPVERLAHHFAESSGNSWKEMHYETLAAERDIARFAYESGVGHYRRALAALERSDRDLERQYNLEHGLAIASALTGDRDETGRAIWSAICAARELEDPDRLANAVSSLCDFQTNVNLPEQAGNKLTLTQESLRDVGHGDTLARVRLLGVYAQELSWAGGWDACDGASLEGVEVARRIGNLDILWDALRHRHEVLIMAADLTEQGEIGEEMLQIANLQGKRYQVLFSQYSRFDHCVARCDRAGADEALAAYGSIAKAMDEGAPLAMYDACVASRSLWRGELTRADEQIQGLFAALDRSLGPHALERAGVLLFVLRYLQGRLAEMEPMTRQIAEATTEINSFLIPHARVLAELGRPVADEVATLTSSLLRNVLFCCNVALLAEADALAQAGQAERLYELLSPFAGRSATTGPIYVLGSVSRYLGQLATGLERFDEAERHLEDALVLERRLGARAWEGLALRDLAKMRLRRDGPGDRDASRTEIDAALEIARDTGMAGLERDLSRLD